MIHGDILGERSRISPSRTALVIAETGQRFTYRELDLRALELARTLIGPLGLAPGERAGILAHNRVELLDLFLACGKCGVVFVPLGTRLTARELAPILADAGLLTLFYDGAFASVVDELKAAHGELRTIPLDRERPGDLTLPQAPADLVLSTPRPEDLYTLLYTSGTTGRPKGVMLPHRMVAWNAYNTVVSWDLREDDVSPIFTPLYHAGGLLAFLTPILLAGGTIVLHAKFDAEAVWSTIASERATVVLGVPTIWRMLLASPGIDRVDPSRIRWLISGGAPLPLELQRAYQERGFVLKQGYGMTEVGVNCFTMTSEESALKIGSIGRPLPFTRAKLVDEDGREVAEGAAGELCLAGPHVCAGYWRNEAATRAALDDDGFFHTGDVATRDEDGCFTIVGRRKDMFISGGVNVYPAEVEAALLEHPDLAEVSVVGVPDETWSEVGVAFVVPSAGRAPSAEVLTTFAAARLARFKVPRAFVMVESLPLTPYGKVVKAELRKLWGNA